VSAAALVLFELLAPAVHGQELEPRAYSPNPVGANFVLFAYARSTGDILFDPSLPITDVEARTSSATVLYGRTFGLLGRSASAAILGSYAWGTTSGAVNDEQRTVERSGLADVRARVTVNLIGGPALSAVDFAKRSERSTLGASLFVVAPAGQYDSSRLINIGTNRWALKPELGWSQPMKRWVFEVYAAAWLYADNEDFFGGSVREQSPLYTLQTHVSYTFRPRLWLAGDATFYTGGSTTLDGVAREDRQENARLGLTLSVPVGRRHALKVSGSTGAVTRIGGDFDTLGVAWQTLWFDRPRAKTGEGAPAQGSGH
jgi:hypothetical protein